MHGAVRLRGELLTPGPEVSGPVLVLEPGEVRRRIDAGATVGTVLVTESIGGAGEVATAPSRRPWLALLVGESIPASEWASGLGPVIRIDPSLFRPGDIAAVHGGNGAVDLPTVEAVAVVTAFLESPDGKILLVRRSSRVGTFQGQWSGISGYLEDPTPEGQAFREVREETGLAPPNIELLARGAEVLARDGNRIFVVHPFRFRARTASVQLDWENTESDWVRPEEIRRRPTVPKLAEAWAAVAGSGAAQDREE
jgi:8-oxo-dGTP diphosphatase